MADLYLSTSEEVSRLMTQRYSTSFGMASRLFAKQIRQDIYNI
jgi:phytoene/squalene synthetase